MPQPVRAAPAAAPTDAPDAGDVPVGAPSLGRWSWLVGVVLGLVVMGPGLGPGSLLNLDLLVTPSIPVPNGLYGLGPALTQRVPFFAILAAGSWLVGGPLATKVVVVALIAVGFVGASRLVAPSGGPLAQLAAGVLWAGGPFAVTRLGAGHLNLLWAVAVLPWVLPRLCRPSADVRRTFLAMVVVSVGGPAAGTLALVIVVVGLLCEPRGARRWLSVAGSSVAASLLWLAPTAVVLWAGAKVSTAGDFSTQTGSVAGWGSILAGGGFWQRAQQVGADGVGGAVAGVLLVLFAVIGSKGLDRRWAKPFTGVGVLGLVLALASAVPGVRVAYEWLSLLPMGAPLRESQRFLALWILWLAPSAALGGAEAARRLRAGPGLAGVLAAAPLAVVVAVSVGGWWGAGGRLEPVTFPDGWARARAVVRAQPGTVVALPWNEYPSLPFAGGRTVFNPVPDYLGGDVISSYDPLFDLSGGRQEQVDGRARVVDHLVDQMDEGVPMSRPLARLGVRWLFVADEPAREDYTKLADDPGLRVALRTPSVTLYEVSPWTGPVASERGRSFSLSRRYAPVISTDAPPGAVLSVAGAPGWVQGWSSPARVTADGRLRLTGTGSVVWFWPAPVLIALDLAVLGAGLGIFLRLRRETDSEH